VIIRGPSGGGKTTFLNLIGTIDRPTNGHIWIDGEMIDSEHNDEKLSQLRRNKIGIVFQTFNLLALMTAYENIELPMRIKGEQSEKSMKDRTKLLLKRVGLM
jgi:putative ABC transport system ATP-binding protein